MAEPLYTLDILRLAASTANLARLDAPDATAERRSPACGSRVTIDLATGEDGKIARIGAEVRACAMGQASTALFARHAIGRDTTEIAASRDALASWLGGGPASGALWPEYSVFAPAIPRTARHAAILLPFDAALAALRQTADA